MQPDNAAPRESCGGLLRRWLVIANLYIWVWIFGALFGGAAIYAVAQGMIAGASLPPPPQALIAAIGLSNSAVTADGLRMSIVKAESVADGNVLNVYVGLENTTLDPIVPFGLTDEKPYLLDGQGRRFIPHDLYLLMGMGHPINPGTRAETILPFQIPPNTKGYSLRFKGVELRVN